MGFGILGQNYLGFCVFLFGLSEVLEMGSVDDQTFNVNFTTEGVGKLREVVKEKLMEFTDFSDDHLVV